MANEAWSKTKQSLGMIAKRWIFVMGPVGTMIMTVKEMGWEPREPHIWEDGEDTLVYDPAMAPEAVAE